MIQRIKNKWGIENNFQIIIILVVFAVTGSVSALFSGPIAEYLKLDDLHFILYWPLRILIVFPIYQILLVFFGFVFAVIISVITFKKDNFIFDFFLRMSIIFSKKLIKFLSFGLFFKE
tara:strand:- start:316 stop:669 length:354 start_codon:yes stop_codon:yes gene_type:complete